MRHALTNNALHNPFHNRFNDPVAHRNDDMQAYAYMAWLRERNQGSSHTHSDSNLAELSLIKGKSTQSVSELEAKHSGRIFAGVFALGLMLLVSVAVLLKAI